MNKLSAILFVFIMLSSVASATLITEYMKDDRTVEVASWMTVEVNNDPRDITYGDALLHDYINITSLKEYSTTCEITTMIYFNGEELIDQEGIYIDYSKETGSGTLILATDYNNNDYPEAAIFGYKDLENMGDPGGSYTIRRNILINEDLVPGIYTITTTLIPFQGN